MKSDDAMTPELKFSGHSPGPWSLDEGGAISDATGETIPYYSGWISESWSGPDATPESVANARLMAQAPAMLEALREIARLRTDLSGDFSMASRQSDIARKALAALDGDGQ